MNTTIRYYSVVNGKKVTVETPDRFPTVIDISKYLETSMCDGVALALTMGDHIREKGLVLPHGILFEKAP